MPVIVNEFAQDLVNDRTVPKEDGMKYEDYQLSRELRFQFSILLTFPLPARLYEKLPTCGTRKQEI